MKSLLSLLLALVLALPLGPARTETADVVGTWYEIGDWADGVPQPVFPSEYGDRFVLLENGSAWYETEYTFEMGKWALAGEALTLTFGDYEKVLTISGSGELVLARGSSHETRFSRTPRADMRYHFQKRNATEGDYLGEWAVFGYTSYNDYPQEKANAYTRLRLRFTADAVYLAMDGKTELAVQSLGVSQGSLAVAMGQTLLNFWLYDDGSMLTQIPLGGDFYDAEHLDLWLCRTDAPSLPMDLAVGAPVLNADEVADFSGVWDLVYGATSSASFSGEEPEDYFTGFFSVDGYAMQLHFGGADCAVKRAEIVGDALFLTLNNSCATFYRYENGKLSGALYLDGEWVWMIFSPSDPASPPPDAENKNNKNK